jgi:hypothetical protein
MYLTAGAFAESGVLVEGLPAAFENAQYYVLIGAQAVTMGVTSWAYSTLNQQVLLELEEEPIPWVIRLYTK